jgi:hypothetical protein
MLCINMPSRIGCLGGEFKPAENHSGGEATT